MWTILDSFLKKVSFLSFLVFLYIMTHIDTEPREIENERRNTTVSSLEGVVSGIESYVIPVIACDKVHELKVDVIEFTEIFNERAIKSYHFVTLPPHSIRKSLIYVKVDYSHRQDGIVTHEDFLDEDFLAVNDEGMALYPEMIMLGVDGILCGYKEKR